MKNKKGAKVFLAALCLIFVPILVLAAGPFMGLAEDISKAAGRLGMSHVAVLPFEAVDGDKSDQGREISEKLTTRVVRLGKISVVERPLLKKIMDEQYLARTGALDSSQIKKLGHVFAVDGIITGSYEFDGETLTIEARLINIETGVILAASERKAPYKARPVESLDADRAGQNLWIPAPVLDVPVPTIDSGDTLDMRDAMVETGNGCSHASERVDRLESQILDIKARYWASRLRQGLPLSSLKENPGSEISDPSLKIKFYERLKSWYAQEDIPPLTASELQTFADLDSKAIRLHDDCGS